MSLTTDMNLYNLTSGPSDDFCPPTKMANGHCDSNGKSPALSIEEDDDDALQFDNGQHPSELLTGLHSLQKQHQFCDAVLRVGEREVARDWLLLLCYVRWYSSVL
jgi:hypothetical protein